MTQLIDLPSAPQKGPASPGERLKWRLCSTWAGSDDEVRAAQALRYSVFAQELGATLPAEARRSSLDADRFDPFCDHLLVWASQPDTPDVRRLVGTYRVLPPRAAVRLGGLYMEQEFDLSPLAPLRCRMIELGRACVHADFRSGGVILMLWNARGCYMVRNAFDTMVGCGSIGVSDGGIFASAAWRTLRSSYLAEHQWRVAPRVPLPLREPDAGSVLPTLRDMPPLIKGYLRGGATVLGPPAYDAHFRTADVPIMMRTDTMTPRYRAQFLQAG